MFKPLSLFLGLRYVRSRHGNGFSSFISASSTTGIALGVMVLIVVLSAMNGFEKELAKRLLSIIPHGEVLSVKGPMNNWRKELATIEQHDDVVAAAPVIKLTGMMQKGSELKGIEFRGVDPVLEAKVSAIESFIISGLWQDLSQDNTVIIGAGVAKKLQVVVGDKVEVLLPKPADYTGSYHEARRFPALMKQHVKVVGIFKFGGTVDEGLVYGSITELGKMMNYQSGQVQGIRIAVTDVFQAPHIIREVANSIDSHVYIYDWTRSQGHIYNDIQLVRMVMFIVLVLVIGVASFNIVSTLIMAVNEKKGDIAILKTMGARASTIMASFIIQGLVNGILGCSIGALTGVYLALNITELIKGVESFFGVHVLAGDIYFINYIPSVLNHHDVIFTVITALLLSFIATIYPAWRATKVDPAEVLGQM